MNYIKEGKTIKAGDLRASTWGIIYPISGEVGTVQRAFARYFKKNKTQTQMPKIEYLS